MLKSVLANLKLSDREAIFHAFEEGETHMVALPGNQFVGVNIQKTEVMRILEERGAFVLGSYE